MQDTPLALWIGVLSRSEPIGTISMVESDLRFEKRQRVYVLHPNLTSASR